MRVAKPCPQIAHTHDLHLYRVITGPQAQVERVTDPPVEDGALYFWAEHAEDLWAILNHVLSVPDRHVVYAADLTEIRDPDRWRLA